MLCLFRKSVLALFKVIQLRLQLLNTASEDQQHHRNILTASKDLIEGTDQSTSTSKYLALVTINKFQSYFSNNNSI